MKNGHNPIKYMSIDVGTSLWEGNMANCFKRLDVLISWKSKTTSRNQSSENNQSFWWGSLSFLQWNVAFHITGADVQWVLNKCCQLSGWQLTSMKHLLQSAAYRKRNLLHPPSVCLGCYCLCHSIQRLSLLSGRFCSEGTFLMNCKSQLCF